MGIDINYTTSRKGACHANKLVAVMSTIVFSEALLSNAVLNRYSIGGERGGENPNTFQICIHFKINHGPHCSECACTTLLSGIRATWDFA
jgi:hypothetical protein